jgi:amino-acid N-acetyltransferase
MLLDSEQFIEWFRSASPYIRVHRGKTFVIQFDDEVILGEGFTELVHDLALLNCLGIRVIITYGIRNTIEQRLKKSGVESSYHHGMRITDTETMELVKEVAGKLRIEIESSLSIGLGNTPMSNASLRVSSGNYVTAKPLGVVDGVDYQFTGELRNIDVDAIEKKLDNNEIVLIPPVAYSTTGEAFNLSTDVLAARLAIMMGADKLIYLIQANGLCDSNGELIRQMNKDEAKSLLSSSNTEEHNFQYIQSTVDAVEQGVDRVHLIDRNIDGAILHELFTRDGAGTMVSSTPYDVIRKASIDDIAGLLDIIEPMEKQGVLVARSREKLELEIDYFTVIERDGVIIACAALYPYDEGLAEIACLVVHKEYSNDGRGDQLMSILEINAKNSNIDRLFIFTTQAEHWFMERGFVDAHLDDIPIERKSLYNIQRQSKLLIKNI